MPQFLDSFTHQVRERRDEIRQKLDRGRVSELDEDLANLIRKNWLPLPSSVVEKEVVAVDGSRAVRPYASGATLYIVRSLALWRKERFRMLDVDSFLSKAKSTDIGVFVNIKMEHLEFEVARKAVLEADLSNVVLLIDGSLFGRMTHLPKDQPAEGMKSFMLQYFDTYHNLLELCRERNILLLGISKDSRSSFLRDYLLSLLFGGEVDKLKGIDPEDREKLLHIFEEAFDRPSIAFSRFRQLMEKYADKLSKIESILYEVVAARPDHQLIRNYIERPGHTVPIELSFSGSRARMTRQIQKEPDSFIRSRFKETILETSDEHKFLQEAVQTISLLPDFPTMISFHVLLDRRDTPVRVDTPSWTFGREYHVKDFKGSRKVLVNVNDIIGILVAGYAGLRDYNIWLKRVDEEVRLSRDTVDELYSSALEKLLGVTIIHTRGYRRVKYP